MNLKIALLGYGRMGKEIERAAQIRGHQIVEKFDVGNLLTAETTVEHVDVFIEFSQPDAALNNIELAARLKKPIVVGTTGWYDHLQKVERMIEKSEIGLIYASNFSIGMNLFFRVVEYSAHLFDKFQEYDPLVHELHHRGKMDSPSGTALTLANSLLDKISRKTELLKTVPEGKIADHQLHISSSRVGSIPGTHAVVFDSEADTIELKHVARNRAGFALGAVYAAEWIKEKRGIFTMADFLDTFFDKRTKK